MDIVELNVVEDDAVCRSSAGGSRISIGSVGPDADRGIAEDRVDDRHGADSKDARGSSRSHINTNTTIVDVEALVGPSPIPKLVDGSLAAIEAKVAHSKLLVSNLQRAASRKQMTS